MPEPPATTMAPPAVVLTPLQREYSSSVSTGRPAASKSTADSESRGTMQKAEAAADEEEEELVTRTVTQAGQMKMECG